MHCSIKSRTHTKSIDISDMALALEVIKSARVMKKAGFIPGEVLFEGMLLCFFILQ